MELDKLQLSLNRIEEFQQFIDKATAQKSKFPLAVVQKVILNYELRLEVEKDTARTTIDKIVERVSIIQEQIQHLIAQAKDAEDIQELELMYVIGALTEDDYQRQKKEIEKSLQAEGLEELKAELDGFQGIINRWNRISNQSIDIPSIEAPAEQQNVETPSPVSAVEQKVSLAPPIAAEAIPPSLPEESIPEPAETPQEPVGFRSVPSEEPPEDLEPAHSNVAPVNVPPPPPLPFEDPMSAMIEVEEDSYSDIGALPEPVSDEMVIEDSFAEVGHETFIVDDAEPVIGEKFMQDSFADDSFASLGEALPLELEDELAPDLDMSFDAAPIYDEAPVSNEIRSAILLKNEGSPQEEVYTFSGEQYSIGRHQENNIQIKGDTKVSRFHCKLFLRNGHFYIEDQHSSNGTLVNGELISERRLYGGEELKIGETIFRFRLQ